MDLTRYVDDLQQRLTRAAEIGGDEAQHLARLLSAPLDAAVRLVLLDALSVAAGEISADLAPGSVDVRLRAGEPEFVVAAPVTVSGHTEAAPAAPAPTDDGDGDGSTTRTTLRLPDHLKTRVEAAAARDGISVNAWLVRAVSAALTHAGAPTAPAGTTRTTRTSGGTHVTGWVR